MAEQRPASLILALAACGPDAAEGKFGTFVHGHTHKDLQTFMIITRLDMVVDPASVSRTHITLELYFGTAASPGKSCCLGRFAWWNSPLSDASHAALTWEERNASTWACAVEQVRMQLPHTLPSQIAGYHL